LTNIQANTIYHFKILSTASGANAPTNDLTLTTSKTSTYTPASSLSAVPTIPSPLLSIPYGTRSSSVVSLQNQLISLGFLASGLNTGYYGSLTQAAIAKYQASLKTQATIPSTQNTQSPNSQLQTPNSSTFTRTLTLGSTGADVKALQVFLNNHGYIVASAGPGSKANESTYYGPATAAAISRFQLAHFSTVLAPYGLTKGTGNFGPATMKVVNGMK
jgi:peptidoglycan hydrolase-like protein with peptidoglycan-binding domain